VYVFFCACYCMHMWPMCFKARFIFYLAYSSINHYSFKFAFGIFIIILKFLLLILQLKRVSVYGRVILWNFHISMFSSGWNFSELILHFKQDPIFKKVILKGIFARKSGKIYILTKIYVRYSSSVSNFTDIFANIIILDVFHVIVIILIQT